MLRCQEHIHNGTIVSTCFIPSEHNPADAFTKQKPNKKLLASLSSNFLHTSPRCDFMLQTSPFWHADFIPTSSVPMPQDSNKDLQFPEFCTSSSAGQPSFLPQTYLVIFPPAHFFHNSVFISNGHSSIHSQNPPFHPSMTTAWSEVSFCSNRTVHKQPLF